MLRKAFLSTCSLLLLSQSFYLCATAQTPIASIASTVASSDSILQRPNLNLKQFERNRGTLLLCGGGPIPLAVREEFYDLGKGSEGSLVLIPTASPRSDSGDYSMWIDYWSGFHWRDVSVLHIKNREGAFESDLIATLRGATAVWLSGGEQQRLSDRFAGTPVEKELHALIARGGIVGGTSAGAAIASSTIIADGIVEPRFADGLQFLPGTIIDQHFSQRKRQGRLIKAIEKYPDRIGIGIDESTGLIVNKEESRVVGDGEVYLVNSESIQNGYGGIRDAYRRLRSGEKLKTMELGGAGN